MGFLKFGKKRKIPDELPDLISDEIEKESLDEINSVIKNQVSDNKNIMNESKDINKKENIETKKIEIKKPTTEEVNRKKQVVDRLVRSVEEVPKNIVEKKSPMDKSFFSDLQKNLLDESADIDSLEKLYTKKFESKDMIEEMKTYWDNQKKLSDLDELGEKYKKEIAKKIENLQRVEKDWQLIYFDLVDKESKIKESELEIKGLLKEFMKVCKNRKKELNEVSKDKYKNNKKEACQQSNNGKEKNKEKNNEVKKHKKKA